jgi:hypothetical protein
VGKTGLPAGTGTFEVLLLEDFVPQPTMLNAAKRAVIAAICFMVILIWAYKVLKFPDICQPTWLNNGWTVKKKNRFHRHLQT